MVPLLSGITMGGIKFTDYAKAVKQTILFKSSPENHQFFEHPTCKYHDYMIQVTNARTNNLIYCRKGFENTREVNLNVWYFDNFPGRNVLLFVHGSYGNISHRRYVIEECQRQQINCLMYDFRGYGHSTGISTTNNIRPDADMIYAFLLELMSKNKNKLGKIALWGESLGGHVAAYLSSKHSFHNVILFCTFSRFSDIIALRERKFFEILSKGVEYFAGDNMESVKFLESGNNNDVTIVHSSQDELIPYKCAVKTYNCLKESARSGRVITLVTIKGAHSKPELSQEQGDMIFSLVDSLMSSVNVERMLENILIIQK